LEFVKNKRRTFQNNGVDKKMKIKKTYLTALALIVIVLAIALIGFAVWNQFIIPSLGNLSNLSLFLIVGLAFLAGVVSFFSPCGLALLPTVFSYNLKNFSVGEVTRTRVLSVGVYSALGILSFYALLGLIFSFLGSVFFPYLQTLQYVFAMAIIALGIIMVKNIAIRLPFQKTVSSTFAGKVYESVGFKNYYLFGFGYGLAIMGCVAPVVSALLIFPFIVGNFSLGISAFISYGIAQAVMLTIFAWTSVFSEKNVFEKALKSSGKIQKLAGIGLIIGGIILLIYYIFFGMGWIMGFGG